MLAARELITTDNNVAFNRFARLEIGYTSKRLYTIPSRNVLLKLENPLRDLDLNFY